TNIYPSPGEICVSLILHTNPVGAVGDASRAIALGRYSADRLGARFPHPQFYQGRAFFCKKNVSVTQPLGYGGMAGSPGILGRRGTPPSAGWTFATEKTAHQHESAGDRESN
ncbi:MAG: hypothetical protein JSV16_01250, partial [Candidatus Hydrogenedentota bacterium]